MRYQGDGQMSCFFFHLSIILRTYAYAYVHIDLQIFTSLHLIQTASVLNPKAAIILLSPGAMSLSSDITSLPNVKNEVITFVDTLQTTPSLIQWYKDNHNLDRKFFKADLSDALRFAIVSLRGGVYLDTDMISLKPISYAPMNSLGMYTCIHIHIYIYIYMY